MPPDPEPRHQDRPADGPGAAVCLVLAGGRGSRIGGEKAMIPFAGRPLVCRPLEAALEAGLRPVIVAKRDSRLELPGELAGIEILREPDEPRHPLAGLAHGLGAIGQPVVCCPCDAPLLPAALLAHLASTTGPTPVILEVGGRMEPLIGRYPPATGEHLMRAAGAGRPSHAAVADLSPTVLGEAELSGWGDPALMVRSANDPADLAELEDLALSR